LFDIRARMDAGAFVEFDMYQALVARLLRHIPHPLSRVYARQAEIYPIVAVLYQAAVPRCAGLGPSVTIGAFELTSRDGIDHEPEPPHQP
ncbi:MAG TPA: hypothetical protein QF630_07715, partial [Alphaproteobacteria bacterium]|nr:hypothetical protein [Alphaproteobacteria bacterium]